MSSMTFPPSPFPWLTKPERRLINQMRWARKVLAEAPPDKVRLPIQIEQLQAEAGLSECGDRTPQKG